MLSERSVSHFSIFSLAAFNESTYGLTPSDETSVAYVFSQSPTKLMIAPVYSYSCIRASRRKAVITLRIVAADRALSASGWSAKPFNVLRRAFSIRPLS